MPITRYSRLRRRRGRPKESKRHDLCTVKDRAALARYVEWLVSRAGDGKRLAERTHQRLPASRISDYRNGRRGEMAPGTRLALLAAMWQAGKHPTLAQSDRLKALLNRAVAPSPPLASVATGSRGRWTGAVLGNDTGPLRWQDLAMPHIRAADARQLARGVVPSDVWRTWPVGQWVRVSRQQANVLLRANPSGVLDEYAAYSPRLEMPPRRGPRTSATPRLVKVLAGTHDGPVEIEVPDEIEVPAPAPRLESLPLAAEVAVYFFDVPARRAR